MSWYTIKDQLVIITVWAKPNAHKTQFVTIDDRCIHISLQARPDEGKANKALIDFLAKQLGVAKKEIKLKRGSKSRCKQIELAFDGKLVEQLELINKRMQP